jgi:hypothetical protein
MSDRLALATRVMKARRTSVCHACDGLIVVGQSIARLTSPPGWIHLRCVPAVARVLTTLDGGPPVGSVGYRSHSP